MESHQMPALPPPVDPPEFCFCSKKTTESHEYWYCSTDCARSDALRSLDDRHYRNVVRRAYIRAGAQEPSPRRMMSVDQFRPRLPDHRRIVNKPPRFPPPTSPLPTRPSAEGDAPLARDRDMVRFPTLSQVAGKILTKKTTEGESLVTDRQDRPRWEGFSNASSRARPPQRPLDQPAEQIDLDLAAIPTLEPNPLRTLRRVPQSTNSLRNNIRKSVVALLKLRKDREGEDSERPFDHPVNIIIPPVRKESLPLQSQKSPPSPSAFSERRSKVLRRSVSFAGWDANPQGSGIPSDPLTHILRELREECDGNFDPMSFFDTAEIY